MSELARRRHERAVAAALAVAGPSVSEPDWSGRMGYGVAQVTEHGVTWTWSPDGRKERIVHMWNEEYGHEAFIEVCDQAAAGRVSAAYLRALVGDGPSLHVEVQYAGRYDRDRTYEENAATFGPQTMVFQFPSLVPGAPAVGKHPLPFRTDPPFEDDEEDFLLAA